MARHDTRCPETDLVLALARGDLDFAATSASRVLDWISVHRIASAHRVETLCFWNWCQNDVLPFVLPYPIWRKWKYSYGKLRLQRQTLDRELADILRALSSRDINFLVLKGPWLALEAYPDPATRSVGDIDLCIHEQDYCAAVEALGTIGYSGPSDLPDSPENALRRAHYRGQIRLRSPGKRMVELHFRLCNVGPPTHNEEWIWNSARTLATSEGPVHVPGPEAMLLNLLIHANQHGFGVLRLLHDIRWAIARDGGALDVSVFLSAVKRLRCEASVYHAMSLAGDLASAESPAELLERTRPPWARRRLFSMIWRLGAVRTLRSSHLPEEMEGPILFLTEMGTLSEKIDYLNAVTQQAGGLRSLLSQTMTALKSSARIQSTR